MICGRFVRWFVEDLFGDLWKSSLTMHCFSNKDPLNAEEYCQKPFTLHFYGVSCWVTGKYRSEGLRQPFTPLNHWHLDVYIQKVKGEGFLQIFFCTDNLRHWGNCYHIYEFSVRSLLMCIRSLLMCIRSFLMYIRSLLTNNRWLLTKIAWEYCVC